MQHPSESVTAVIVVATGALRRAAWVALLAQQPGLAVTGMTGTEGELRGIFPTGGQVAILLDTGAMDVDRAETLVGAANGVGALAVLDQIDLAIVVPLLKAGVTGCIQADSPASDLVRALVAVGRGEISLPPSIAARALAELARPVHLDRHATDELSERERDVIRLLVRGQTNKDMAQALFLSVRTVEAHLRSIYAKLGVRSRTEAVLWAVRQSPDERGRE